MLYVNTDRTHVWHVGEPLPDVQPEDVTKLYADGDELAFLLQFAPCRPGRCYEIEGDDAKYIFEQLKAFYTMFRKAGE